MDGEKGDRPACPEAVIREIKKQALTDSEQITRIKKALDGIAKAAGYGAKSAFYSLRNDRVAALFVNNVDDFVEMAKALGDGSNALGGDAISWAFDALRDEKIAKLFEQNSAGFIGIAKAVGKNSRAAGNAFNTFRDRTISSLFLQNSAGLAEMAKISGNSVAWAFSAIGNGDRMADLFVKKPKAAIDAFAEIAKAAGKGKEGAFQALGNREISDLLAMDQDIVIDAFARIAKAAGENADQALYSLSHDKTAGIFVKHTQEFVKIAEATGDSTVAAAFDATRYIGFDSVSQVAFSEIPIDGKARIFSGKRLISDTLDESQRSKLFEQIFNEEKSMLPLFRKFGVKPSGILGFLGKGPNIGEPPETKAAESAIVSKIGEVSRKLDLDPNFFAAAIFQEGLAAPKTFDLVISGKKFEINSSDDIGMDSFLQDLPILVRKGYLRELRENEDYVKTGNANHMNVESARLKDYSVMIEAFGAMLALRRDYFMDYCKSRGLKPSQGQAMLGTYYFFNASDPVKTIENIGFRHLEDRYSGKPGLKDINDPRYNALRVYVTALYLQESGII
ncbi:MAG: hypothetical protein NTY68_03270 [Candidatus Micrarchaeota archaeon]|nr:hypothetical protein [Candidatus Micrarchaeota archaeon]